MALLILPDGTFLENWPCDTLQDWQNAVEGYVEAIHLRNGDTAKLRGPGHKLRYTRAVDLVPMMSVVAALPSR